MKLGEAYHLIAVGDEAYRLALDAICGDNVCTVQNHGSYYVIQVVAP